MKTTKEWFESLDEKYREKALKNMTSPESVHASLLGAISNGFDWVKSVEGTEFWKKAFIQIRDGVYEEPEQVNLDSNTPEIRESQKIEFSSLVGDTEEFEEDLFFDDLTEEDLLEYENLINTEENLFVEEQIENYPIVDENIQENSSEEDDDDDEQEDSLDDEPFVRVPPIASMQFNSLDQLNFSIKK